MTADEFYEAAGVRRSHPISPFIAETLSVADSIPYLPALTLLSEDSILIGAGILRHESYRGE
ncbi:MAG TPA: hypothetical protein VKP88_07655 [Candidatus Paceibacterota bacterium]|nr:hypothetical protein [Candidatus Paceibacterota bacterium]